MGGGACCLPKVSSRVIFTTFVFVLLTSSKDNKLQDGTHQESYNMGTRLCLVGVRRMAQMYGFHLGYHVKFMLCKVEIHLSQLWFVHLVLLKQVGIAPEVAAVS